MIKKQVASMTIHKSQIKVLNSTALFSYRAEVITSISDKTAVATESEIFLSTPTDSIALHMPNDTYVRRMAFSKSGRYLAAVGYDGVLTVFDLKPPTPSTVSYPVGTMGESLGLFSASSNENDGAIWIVVRNEGIFSVKASGIDQISTAQNPVSASYSSNKHTDTLTVFHSDWTIRSYEIKDGKVKDAPSIVRLQNDWEGTFPELKFGTRSPDGKVAVLIGYDSFASGIYDVTTICGSSGRYRHPILPPEPIAGAENTNLLDAVFSKTGDFIWVSNEQGGISLYNAANGKLEWRFDGQRSQDVGEPPLVPDALHITPEDALLYCCGETVWKTEKVEHTDTTWKPQFSHENRQRFNTYSNPIKASDRETYERPFIDPGMAESN